MDRVEWVSALVQEGLPGELLLAFSVLILGIFSLILLANPHNRLNIWCFIGGVCFSIGALKEYLYYTLSPLLVLRGIWSVSFAQTLYSLLSAAFYYLSLPPILIFAYYFHRWDRRIPRTFRRLCLLTYLPGILLAFLFPCTQTVLFQQDPVFCLAVAGYNWCMGIIATAIILHELWEERMSTRYQQRRLAAVTLLIPLWVWLVSAFPYHALGIPNLSKIWQFNLLVVFFILLYYFYHAFREGIWGLRFRREAYDWSGGGKVLQRNAQYVGHALKNDLSKIEWCTRLLREQGVEGRELEIISRSVAHLKQFVSRTQLYAQEITVLPRLCDIGEVFESVAADMAFPPGRGIAIRILSCDSAPLSCDRTHLEEVLRNLIANAADAMPDGGEIALSYHNQRAKGKAVIAVADNGSGVPPEQIGKLFEPYYTTKNGALNMGLGLYYCWNVMAAHGGSIRVDSKPGCGSTFFLRFPVRRKSDKN